MPRQRITKEMVVDAAFELARRGGMEKATVKAIGEKLGCSVQPIYSYCQNVEDLRNDVAQKAREFVLDYARRNVNKEDLFRSTGQAYVRLAKEEPHIYRMFLFQERKNISSMDDLYRAETNPAAAELIARDLGISVSGAKQLHLHMLIYSIGIGMIYSVMSSSIGEKEIFEQQEKAYEAFLKAALEENGNE